MSPLYSRQFPSTVTLTEQLLKLCKCIEVCGRESFVCTFVFLDLLLTLLLFLQFFFRGEVGELADVREEGNRFADSRCSCLGDVDCMATVMVWGSADISSVLSMRLPCSALCGDFENQDFCSWWRHWFLVVVVDPV